MYKYLEIKNTQICFTFYC